MSSLPPIDWPVAVTTSAQTLRPGPSLSAAERATLVAELRAVGEESLALAQQTCGLPVAPPVPVRVVGRRGWIEANVDAVGGMLGDAADSRPREQWSLGEKVQGRVAAGEVGLALGWIAGRIIGQFEPFGTTPSLLLVAPNVVETERSLGLDARDFRRWVCVHEQTHRLQFNAAPWLPDHLRGLLSEALATQGKGLRRPRAQREVIERVTAVMSVLEGYAEVMMDSIGPDVIPSVAHLRAQFQTRREQRGIDRLWRALLGMETKYAQYRDGAAFCRNVLERSDLDTLNLAYNGPESLPTLAELHRPASWLARVA